MTYTQCKICKSRSRQIFNAKILQKYLVKYYFCEHCGFLQTEEPYWLDEAYKQSINLSDTGIIKRNLNFAKLTTLIIFFFYNKNKRFLDFAGGHGIFVRLMRDIGLDFYWQDKYCKNLFARGFEYKNGLRDIDLITSFESFEHFDNPVKEVETMLRISKNILFSTELFNKVPPDPTKWEYYAFEHGQHISFYNLKTLNFIAQKFNLNLYTNNRTLHLLTQKKLSNLGFQSILKLNSVGLFHIIKKFLHSKTIDDWRKLK